jgi:predicted molibdopterin-dependent oxidoreductase YjgC
MSRLASVTVDGVDVAVDDQASVLDACRLAGRPVPTLCYGETLTPANACRICMVDVDGSRVLVPACSRRVEADMVVTTDSERARTARRLVLELLGSSVDLSRSPHVEEWMAEYGADADRFGPRAPQSPPRAEGRAGEHESNDGANVTVLQPARVDNDLYVRDYARCILCYKCVDACGEQWQNSFAITVAGRGFDAYVSAEFDADLTDSACVYCGNCIAVCPTGALMARREFDMRAAGTWAEDRQALTTTICPYCGVGCNVTLHVQDNEIVKVTSPADHSVTHGNLCIKGRFGFDHVQKRAPAGP